MTTSCPRARELTRLIDGELTENRAAELRAHVGACGSCRAELDAQQRIVARLSSPLPGAPADGVLDALLRRIAVDAPPPVPARPRRAWLLGGLAAASAVAVAAVALAPRAPRDPGEFSARGAAVEWTRKVGVELWALEASPRRLAPGDRLAPGVPLVASFSNVDAAPVYLLAFALDARGEVHWLYPAFLDPRTDPESVRLDGAVVHRALPESVVLEDVPPGPLRLVAVVTRAPLRVSSVESVAAAERTPAALRGRWPEARVDEVAVTFAPSPSDR